MRSSFTNPAKKTAVVTVGAFSDPDLMRDVIVGGTRSRSEEVEKLRGLVPDFFLIGNAIKAGNILQTVRTAYDAVMDLG